MASTYPGTLDNFATTRANATATTNTHPADHNDLADAVNKIEAELGTDPAGAVATVKARLDAIEAAAGSLFWQPASVGAYDDYFDSDSSADWTAVAIAGTSDWNIRHQARLGVWNRGLLANYEEQVAGDWPAYLKPLTGITTGDYIQTSISLLRYPTGLSMPLIAFTDGAVSGSTVAAFGPEINGSGVGFLVTIEGTLADAQTFDVVTDLQHGAYFSGVIHYRLEYDASNSFKCFWSLNGEDWVELVTLASTLTPTHGGFVVSSYGTGGPARQALFRYFHSNVTP